MEVLIGLGGNLGDVAAAFGRSRETLAARFGLVACSSLWRTRAVGHTQPDYLNAALVVRSGDPPAVVLSFCQRLEADEGRDRGSEERWGPRTLDLDLLLIPDVVIETPTLVVPHPRLDARRFALLPAAEVAPGWLHPRRQRTIAELAAALDAREQPCLRLGRWE
ncbi:MAG: 2-amino-4-hydroxy-6-hydroxymethyldihydropteridine diphosphokinase [Acidobacteriota bacterium]